jgi:tRNA (cmo5U34)-methyltransferase
MLPKHLIEGASILDLGSCIGATGHWCLSNGARHYTGVEIQSEFVNTSNTLLKKYWNTDQYTIVQKDLKNFLENNVTQYDIVIAVGIIYIFLDTYTILELISNASRQFIILDCLYPTIKSDPESVVITLHPEQLMVATEQGKAYKGLGARPSPNALRMLMGTLGFEDRENLLYPAPLKDKEIHDTYVTLINKPGSLISLPIRYLIRFVKSSKKMDTMHTNLLSNSGKTDMAQKPEFIVESSWKFDKEVANRFQQEAECHIPDYHRVINLCVWYVQELFRKNKDIKIIDVGSALGFTMEKFINAGYTEVYGVENSSSMIENSKYPDRVINSSIFPNRNWNVVLANWTLHFIQDRTSYIQDIYNNMEPGGVFILSDKMSHTQETENLYYNFKRLKGVSDTEIQIKKQQLVGVLVTKPITWYLETLKEIGFTNIQIINSSLMFATIYARKPF